MYNKKPAHIGIDPGKKGGIALIANDEITYNKMPLVCTELYRLISDYYLRYSNLHIYVEQVQYRPNQRGVMTTLVNYGRLLGYIESFNLPYEIVSAQKWKKHYKLSADKVEAVNLANSLFGLTLKKSEDGIAEALLIAKYGKYTHK